jgi:16S rRNA A1518/A1519 N6-dimethyltransferase RsmA/KsgA/DIM1 with predicted DNA glycosylase/AP lyase activity
VDPAVHAISRELLAGATNVDWVLGDGAAFAGRAGSGPLRIVSNLPYGVWQDLVLAILEAPQRILSATLMVQSDVYERLKAGPGTRSYGPMSVLVQATCRLKRVRKAGRGLFLPVPGVDSTVFELSRPDPVPGARALRGALEWLFEGRRKKSAVAGGRRVESLGPSELLGLARQVLGGQ